MKFQGTLKEIVVPWSTGNIPSHLSRPDRLLVGAPREKAEPNVPANLTGGVYSCPITADQSDCSRMKLIDPGETYLYFVLGSVVRLLS